MTQRPDLFHAVVCVAPLLDMIRYTTSELDRTWTVEYGDPQMPEQFGGSTPTPRTTVSPRALTTRRR